MIQAPKVRHNIAVGAAYCNGGRNNISPAWATYPPNVFNGMDVEIVHSIIW
jgi:hypothetical protein